ncbi:MAG: AMP-binding protein, partial [Thiomonas sp.]
MSDTEVRLQSYACGRTDQPLITQTLGDFFDAMAERQGLHEALVVRHQDVRLSYAELKREVDRLASSLLRSGLRKGDRVGIWAHNSVEWVLMQLATAKVGIILVNINPAYRVAEVEYALNKVGCKALVTMPSFKTSDYLAMLRELAPELAHCEPGALRAARVPDLRLVVHTGDAEEPGMLRFADWIARGSANDPAVAQVAATLNASDPINIQFTSGTTGFPKGATLTHRNILNNGYFIGEAMKLTAADRLCIP